MSKCLRLKKVIAYAIFSIIVSGCAPLIPDNYLAPSRMRTPHKIHGQWREQDVIPISAQMLNTPEGQRLLKPAMQPQPYRIGPFDNLDIIVWGHPEVSTISSANTSLSSTSLSSISGSLSNPSILVQTDGTIFYPYVGHLRVSGLTVDETQASITRRLSLYIRNPQVTVKVAKFRNSNVYVLGEVKKPGLQPLTDKPLTLMEAISTADGINPASADPTHIYLVRGSYLQPQIFLLDAQTPQALLIAERFPLQENDIVYVSAAALNSWNNFISTVLPFFTEYYTIKGFVNG